MLTNAPATNSATVGLHDIRPPVEIPNYWLWVWCGAGVLAAAGLAILAWWWWRNRRKQVLIVPAIPAHIRAKQKLHEALSLLARPKPFCIAVSDTVRSYLEERFEFRAPERTTEEFLCELQGTNLLLPVQKESLGEFLKSCDLVKFARYEPREPELRGLHGSAVRLVEETEPQPQPLETQHPKLETSPA